MRDCAAARCRNESRQSAVTGTVRPAVEHRLHRCEIRVALCTAAQVPARPVCARHGADDGCRARYARALAGRRAADRAHRRRRVAGAWPVPRWRIRGTRRRDAGWHERDAGRSAADPHRVPGPRWLGERITRCNGAAWLLGLAGVYLVVRHKIALGGDSTALVAIVVALVGISVGTLYQKKYCGRVDLRTGAVVQFAACVAALRADRRALRPAPIAWTGSFMFALGWSVIVLSVGAISLLYWLLRHGAAADVARLFYLVPPVTALMAFVLFGERLDATGDCRHGTDRVRGGAGTAACRMNKNLIKDLYRYIWSTSARDQIAAVDHVRVRVPARVGAARAAAAHRQRRGRAPAVPVHRDAVPDLSGRVAAARRTQARHERLSRLGRREDQSAPADAACADRASRSPRVGDAGVRISIIVSEAEAVGGFAGGSFSEPVLNAGILLSVFGYMLYVQPWMALVALLMFCPQLLFIPALQEAINRRTKRRIETLRAVSGAIVHEAAGRRERTERHTSTTADRLCLPAERADLHPQVRHQFPDEPALQPRRYRHPRGRRLARAERPDRSRTIVAFISGVNRMNSPWGT